MNFSRYEIEHKRRINQYLSDIKFAYNEAINEIVLISGLVALDIDKPFTFDNKNNINVRANQAFSKLNTSISGIIGLGIVLEWDFANKKNDTLVGSVLKNAQNNPKFNGYYSNNLAALEAFQQRKINGMNLSRRVWNLTDTFKTQMELGIEVGLRNGISASEMSRNLREYLNEPKKLFRRVREVITDENGNKIKMSRLLESKAMKAYNPGQGVYRSSYRNAIRLTATEINMAYRKSDAIRWQQLDFIVGINIKISNNRKRHFDICDELQGKYPKDFVFIGWHPFCRCYAVPIMKTMEELEDDNERILNGEETDTSSENEVTELQSQMTDYLEKNREKILSAKTLPYWYKENKNILKL